MNQRDRFSELLYLLFSIVCFSFLFRDGFSGYIPAFRDTFHFYYPQYAWLDQCAALGEHFPRWNRLEGLGTSPLGQGTAQIYYPLRILFYLPFALPTRLTIFIVAHLVIAACGLRIATRCFRVGPRAGWLAALAFALSCPVLFSHTNIIYLVSASWLGFAATAAITLFQQTYVAASSDDQRKRSITRFIAPTLLFTFACCMMVSGGDPHTAINCYIVTTATTIAVLLFRLLSAGRLKSATSAWASVLSTSFPITCIGTSIILATIILIPVWRPMLAWSELSGRSVRQTTSTQSPASQTTTDEAASESVDLASLAAGSKMQSTHRIYDFSFSPWHLATLPLPTVGGSYTPEHSRAFNLLKAEGRMWIPSLFLGSLPLCIFLFSLRPKYRRRLGDAAPYLLALQLIALGSTLAAFGSYTAIWLAGETLDAIGLTEVSKALPRDPVSGVYWMLTELVPGYSHLRYPAKWTVFISLSISLTVGIVAQTLLDEKRGCAADGLSLYGAFAVFLRRLSWVYVLCLVALGITCVAVWSGLVDVDAFVRRNTRDQWLGHATTSSILRSLAFSIALPTAIVCGLRVLATRFTLRYAHCLSIAELMMAATAWIAFVPPPSLTSDLAGSRIQLPAALADGRDRLLWADTSHGNISAHPGKATRASEVAGYQARWGLGKLWMSQGLANLGTSSTITPLELQSLRHRLASLDDLTPDQPLLDRLLSRVGVTHRLARIEDKLVFIPIDATEPLCSTKHPRPDDSLDWDWHGVDALEIRGSIDAPDDLVVRQYNDGGWSAQLTSPNAEKRNIASERGEFGMLVLKVPAGNWTIRLKRIF